MGLEICMEKTSMQTVCETHPHTIQGITVHLIKTWTIYNQLFRRISFGIL